MNKQVDVNELIPSEQMDEIRHFIESEYIDRVRENGLEEIRTRHESYGVIFEHFVHVCEAFDTVKAGMKNCAKALTYTDQGFVDILESIYSGLVEATATMSEMAVHTLNAIYKINDVITSNPLPLEALAEAPLENIDDEDNEVNNEEEF